MTVLLRIFQIDEIIIYRRSAGDVNSTRTYFNQANEFCYHRDFSS